MDKYYFGVDVGGMSIKFGLFDGKKTLITKFHIKTELKSKFPEKEIVDNIIKAIDDFCMNNAYGVKKNYIKGIGITIPGPVVNNVVLRAVNIKWKKKYDIVKAIKRHFGKNINVIVGNDANLALLGETNMTLKGKYKNACLMTLGTAIGTGVMINGEIIEGKTGIAGEICHVKVDYGKEAIKCNCGNQGCLETVVSGRGIVNVYKRLYLKNNKISDVININNKKVKIADLSAADIIRAAKKNDKKALFSVETSLNYLSQMIVVLMHVFEPEVIIIGGGVSNEGEIITNIIKKGLEGKVYITKKLPKVLLSKLKNDAGMYGAVVNL